VISPAGGLVIVEVRCNFSGEGDRPDIWRPSNPGAPSAVLAYLVSGPIGSVFARGSRGAKGPSSVRGGGTIDTQHGPQKLTSIPRATGRDGVSKGLASVFEGTFADTREMITGW
jgi:hypothetical protein